MQQQHRNTNNKSRSTPKWLWWKMTSIYDNWRSTMSMWLTCSRVESNLRMHGLDHLSFHKQSIDQPNPQPDRLVLTGWRWEAKHPNQTQKPVLLFFLWRYLNTNLIKVIASTPIPKTLQLPRTVTQWKFLWSAALPTLTSAIFSIFHNF